jgi:hypothetical protein
MRKLSIFLLLLLATKTFGNANVDKRLLAFAELYSTIKFYYPDPHLVDFSWTALGFKGYELAKNATSDEEFVQEAKALFVTIAPGVQITKGSFNQALLTPPSNLNMINPTFWQHKTALNVGAKADFKQISQNYIFNKRITSHHIYQNFSPVAKKMNDQKIKISFWAKLEGNIDSVKIIQLTPFTRRTKTFANFYVTANSKEWKRYEKIIDYPKEAEVDKIHIVMPHSGTAYLDNLIFEREDSGKWMLIPFKNSDFETFENDGDLVGWEDPFSVGSLCQQEMKEKKEGKSGLKLVAIQDKKLYEPQPLNTPYQVNFLGEWKAFVPANLMSNDSCVYPISDAKDIQNLNDTLAIKIAEKTATTITQTLATAIEAYGYLLHDYIPRNGITKSTLDTYFLQGIHALASSTDQNAYHTLFISFLAWMNDVQIYAQPLRMMFGNGESVKLPAITSIVEKKVVVEKALLKNDKLMKGDWIQKVNNVNLDSLIIEMNRKGISPYLQDLMKNKYFNFMFQNEMNVTINRKGKTIEQRFLASDNIKQKRAKADSLAFDEIEETKYINSDASTKKFYFNPTKIGLIQSRVSEQENNHMRMDSLVNALNKYETIVIDFRDANQTNFMEYFIGYISKFDVSKSYEIEKKSFQYLGEKLWQLLPPKPIDKRAIACKPKIVCLINHNTRGHNESMLYLLKQQKLATFIGEASAGGGVHANQLKFNNNVRFQYSSNLLTDGLSQVKVDMNTRRIQPDVQISQTLQNMVVGKDEAIEMAMK